MAAFIQKGHWPGAAKLDVTASRQSGQEGEMGTVHQKKLPQRQMETNLSPMCLNGPAMGAAPTAPQHAEERQEAAQCPTALPDAATCRGHSYSPAHRLALPPVLVGSAMGFLKAGRGSRLGFHLVKKNTAPPKSHTDCPRTTTPRIHLPVCRHKRAPDLAGPS